MTTSAPKGYDLASNLDALKINLQLLPDGKGHWKGRDNRVPIAIVYHITDGDDNTVAWFHSAACDASAHFTIDRDGSIYQFVTTTDTAWSNGNIQGKPNFECVPWLEVLASATERVNPNFYTISIEHVGHPDTGVTEAQIVASIKLSIWLKHRWGIMPDRAHMVRHSDFDTITRPFCPGLNFPLGRIITETAAG